MYILPPNALYINSASQCHDTLQSRIVHWSCQAPRPDRYMESPAFRATGLPAFSQIPRGIFRHFPIVRQFWANHGYSRKGCSSPFHIVPSAIAQILLSASKKAMALNPISLFPLSDPDRYVQTGIPWITRCHPDCCITLPNLWLLPMLLRQ